MDWKKAGHETPNADSSSKRLQSDLYPAFAPILSDAFEHLKDLPEKIEIPSGHTLVEQSLFTESIYLLVHGLVKLVYVTAEGRETTLGLRASGWYAGAASALRHTPSVYSVVTITPCRVMRISAEEFPGKLMGSAKLMRHFLGTVCNEIISQAMAQAQVMAGTAEQRLVHYMRERHVEHSGVRTLDTLPLLKQMELAQLLSISPEHLSRLLHKITHTEPSAPAAGSSDDLQAAG